MFPTTSHVKIVLDVIEMRYGYHNRLLSSTCISSTAAGLFCSRANNMTERLKALLKSDKLGRETN